jgi:hypothetical protein
MARENWGMPAAPKVLKNVSLMNMKNIQNKYVVNT